VGEHDRTEPREAVRLDLERAAPPEQGYRSCLSTLPSAKKYGPQRLEAGCTRALAVGARSHRHVESILSHGLDQGEAEWPAEHPRRSAASSRDAVGTLFAVALLS
jgi:hypothetical protein